MKSRIGLLLIGIVLSAAVSATAQVAVVSAPALVVASNMNPYNVILSDEGTGYLRGCTELRVYGVELDRDVRTTPDPVVVRVRAESETKLLLQPGRYELAIWMFYLPSEVHFLYFSVPDSGVCLIDLMAVEFPQELVTY